VARYTSKDGKRRVAGTYAKKGPCKAKGTDCCAQHAIDAAYIRDEAAPTRTDTLGGYFAGWLKDHPRSRVTDRTNAGRIRAMLGVERKGVALKDWPYDQLRRRHTSALITHMLAEEGRALLGVRNILASLSAMTEDALTDEVAIGNPFKGVKVRANDPRIQKAGRQIRTWEWEQMHAFARACGVVSEDGRSDGAASREYRAAVGEPMARVLSDCGLRIGELLALRRCDLHLDRGILEVRQTLTDFGIEAGTKGDKLRGITDPDEIGREVPLTAELVGILKGMPKRIDSNLLFPAPQGGVWWRSEWFRDVWQPAQKRSGMDPRPHEMRHSFASLMRAAGVNDDDLAEVLGHTVLTMLRGYSHPLRRSYDSIRMAVGE
jgi:integrase